MYGILVWAVAIVLSAALLLVLAWALKPALQVAWVYIMSPHDGARLQVLGKEATRRTLVAVLAAVAYGLLSRLLVGGDLDRTTLVNYMIASGFTLMVSVTCLVGTIYTRRRGGGG